MRSFRVYVNDVSSGEVANYLRGYIRLGGERFNFRAIAYGRYGGQNVSPEFTRTARKRLVEAGMDILALTQELQQKLVLGRITIASKTRGSSGTSRQA